MPGVVPYLHVADLSVVRERVVWVVPEGRAVEGEPLEGTGGLTVVVRERVVAETGELCSEVLAGVAES